MHGFLTLTLPLLLISAGTITYVIIHKNVFYDKRRRKHIKTYASEGMTIGLCLGIALSCVHICRISTGICLGILLGTIIGMNIEKKDEEKDGDSSTENN
ncbi:MAG: hypothetical protein PUE13_07300 [Clostridiales bacterium]|nr:hypothetical protein [Clostridiales bacterium]